MVLIRVLKQTTQRRGPLRAAVMLAGLAVSASLTPAEARPSDKWGAHIDLEGKLGSKRTLGEGSLFLPLAQSARTLFFGDIRMRFDDAESHEANVGLGIRHMLDSGWNIGGYSYFDRRQTGYDNTFNQITLGAEALGHDVDLRVNGYWAIGERKRVVDSLNMAEISGTSVMVRGGEERAMSGFDAEVGWRAPVFDAEAAQQLRFYAGGYRFTGDGVDDVSGPRVRVDYTMNELPFLWEGSRLSFGAEWQHDDPRGSQAFAGIRLRIPLQQEAAPSRLTAQERRMTDPLIRDIDVVTQAGAFGAPEAATRTASGQTLTVLNSATTNGAALPGLVAAAGANSTVILSGTFTTNLTTTLQTGQTLTGGEGLQVMTASGRTATLRGGGATINGSPGAADGTINMGNDSTLSGLTINDTDSTNVNSLAVRADGVSNARIIGNTITATGGNSTTRAVIITGGSNDILVKGNTLTAESSGTVASTIFVSASSATIVDNRLTQIHAGINSMNGHTRLQNATINSGSTGNTVVSSTGGCSRFGANMGTVSYTNAADCGP